MQSALRTVSKANIIVVSTTLTETSIKSQCLCLPLSHMKHHKMSNAVFLTRSSKYGTFTKMKSFQGNLLGEPFGLHQPQRVRSTTNLTPTSAESAAAISKPTKQPLLKSDSLSTAHREVSSSGEATEKAQQIRLRTNLTHTSDGDSHGDTSLLASRRIDPSTVRQVYYFDTLAFTKKLESSGFSRQQAEGCAECLVEIINSTLDHQGRHMVTKPQQEIVVQQLMSEIVSVKKDMTLLQKSEFSSLKTETEKMSIELSQVQGHMADEIVKLKGQFSLDINLERGRAIEAHAENEKKLQQLHNKIETEIANLKTTFEIYRNDVFKYAGGTVLAVGTLMLGVIRLWT